jgi:predicted ATPase
MGTVSGTAVGEDKSRNRGLQDQQEEEEYLAKLSLSQRIGRVKSANELKQLLQQIREYHLPRQSASRGSEALTEFQANKVSTYKHTYIHTYIHTYTHTYIYTHIHT